MEKGEKRLLWLLAAEAVVCYIVSMRNKKVTQISLDLLRAKIRHFFLFSDGTGGLVEPRHFRPYKFGPKKTDKNIPGFQMTTWEC